MSAKHTPGPWIAPSGGIYTESGKLIACISDPRMARQASAPDGIPGMDEGNANARLIAAAPDMLEALEACLKYVYRPIQSADMRSIAREKAIAAINKAVGGRTTP